MGAKPGEQTVPNQLIVRMKVSVDPASVIPGFLRNAEIHALNLPDVYLIKNPNGIPPGIASLLAAHNLVDFVEPNRIRQATAVPTPNDPYYRNSSTNGQWGLFTVQALQAWNLVPGYYLTSATPASGPGENRRARHRRGLRPSRFHQFRRQFDQLRRRRPVDVEREPGAGPNHYRCPHLRLAGRPRPRHARGGNCGGCDIERCRRLLAGISRPGAGL